MKRGPGGLFVVLGLCAASSGCAHSPPSRTPLSVSASHRLDRVRPDSARASDSAAADTSRMDAPAPSDDDDDDDDDG